MKKLPFEEIQVLRKALRIAAVEAYVSEVVELHSEPDGITRPTEDKKLWIQNRMDEWIEQAELMLDREKK